MGAGAGLPGRGAEVLSEGPGLPGVTAGRCVGGQRARPGERDASPGVRAAVSAACGPSDGRLLCGVPAPARGCQPPPPPKPQPAPGPEALGCSMSGPRLCPHQSRCLVQRVDVLAVSLRGAAPRSSEWGRCTRPSVRVPSHNPPSPRPARAGARRVAQPQLCRRFGPGTSLSQGLWGLCGVSVGIKQRPPLSLHVAKIPRGTESPRLRAAELNPTLAVSQPHEPPSRRGRRQGGGHSVECRQESTCTKGSVAPQPSHPRGPQAPRVSGLRVGKAAWWPRRRQPGPRSLGRRSDPCPVDAEATARLTARSRPRGVGGGRGSPGRWVALRASPRERPGGAPRRRGPRPPCWVQVGQGEVWADSRERRTGALGARGAGPAGLGQSRGRAGECRARGWLHPSEGAGRQRRAGGPNREAQTG